MSFILINGHYIDYSDISYIEDDTRTVSVCLKQEIALVNERTVSLSGEDARRFLSWFEEGWKDWNKVQPEMDD